MKSSRVLVSSIVLASALLFSACSNSLESTTTSIPQAASSPSSASPSSASPSSQPSSAAPAVAAPTTVEPSSAAPVVVAPTTAQAVATLAQPASPAPSGETTANINLGKDLPFPSYIDENKPYVTAVLHSAEPQTVGTGTGTTNADDCWYFSGTTVSTGASFPEALMCPLYKDDSAWVLMDPSNNYQILAFYTTKYSRTASDAQARVDGGSIFSGQKVAQSQITDNRIGTMGPLYGFVKLGNGYFTGK